VSRPGNPVTHLAALLAPSGPRTEVPTTSAAWEPLLKAASRHRLVPALWSALRGNEAVDAVPEGLALHWQNQPGDRVPVELALASAYRRNADHVADLCEQAMDILGGLASAGVRAVPLKGIDAVLAGRYRDPAARTMVDIDILVDPSATDRAETVLDGLGYVTVPSPASTHQLVPRVRPGRAGSIELHRALTVDRWAAVADADAVLDRSARASRASAGCGAVLRASRHDSATHLVAHAYLHDEAYLLWRLPLRCVHETALLVTGPENVDWDIVAGAFSRVGRRRALTAHLALTARLFGVSSPLPTAAVWGYRARATVDLDGHPGVLRGLDQLVWLPRTLGADRMADLYQATDRRSRRRARALHARRAAARAARRISERQRG
jgi:hypothetical protein